jgi:hypothetical protein
MEEASPDSWDKMARLYKACPPNTPTEFCEAAIAVRTAEQAAPGQEEDKNAHVQAPSRPLPRGGRPGQQGQ